MSSDILGGSITHVTVLLPGVGPGPETLPGYDLKWMTIFHNGPDNIKTADGTIE